ncbi:hypothetical protein L6164_032711 [Bauhinia variegata]|uniref:Uncharacterized protein n=1 Tax=Bauhinia variegata TaxID=167791 RepID=A0ACB9KPJ8_BAUVA|nr:hypothetical protein L6164_032711 [Bauhinia variegata]
MGLKGQLPRGVQNCTSLTGLDLSMNLLSGSIPSDKSKLAKFVTSLDLSSNKFSGEIPEDIANCIHLNTLILADNQLSGEIPPQLTAGMARIKAFSVADNYLTGPVPNFKEGVASSDSYANNRGLCGGPLAPCHKSSKDFKDGAVVGFSFSITSVVVIYLFYFVPWEQLMKNKKKKWLNERKYQLRSQVCDLDAKFLEKERQEVLEWTMILDWERWGWMCKARLPNGLLLAVKRIYDLDLFKRQFVSEIMILGRYRHKNLIPLIDFCIEQKERILANQYMSNGSLFDWLNPLESSAMRFLTVRGYRSPWESAYTINISEGPRSLEPFVKFLIMGTMANAIFLFGIAFLFCMNNVTGNLLDLIQNDPVELFDVTKFYHKPTAEEVEYDEDYVPGSYYDAFAAVWDAACRNSTGSVKILVPKGTFLLTPIVFSGPCKSAKPIIFEVEGTIVSPTNPSLFPNKKWIEFSDIDGLVLNGNGVFDGQGGVVDNETHASAWVANDCKTNKNCVPPSSNLMFGKVNNSIVRGITSLNSKWFHFDVSQCKNFTVTDIHITAPGDSPNTDGIHLSECDLVNVANSNIATGDNCISIDQGCINIHIHNNTCGLGHRVSVGNLRLQNDDKSYGTETDIYCLRSIKESLKDPYGYLSPIWDFANNTGAKFVTSLDFSSNKFSGEIPEDIANCIHLNTLILVDNQLSGEIPPQLTAGMARIKAFSVADNYLTGSVPNFKEGVASSDSDANNRGLCGGPLALCHKSSKDFKDGAVVGFSFSITSVSKLKTSAPTISFTELYDATKGSRMDNDIGLGKMGMMYKARLPNGLLLAIAFDYIEDIPDQRPTVLEVYRAPRDLIQNGPVEIFDVTKFYRKPTEEEVKNDDDYVPGSYYDAFAAVWDAACRNSTGSVKILVPKGTFLLTPIVFCGPCKCAKPIVFEVEGTIVSPTDTSLFPNKNWIEFSDIDGLVLNGNGNGVFDGQGGVVDNESNVSAWSANDCKTNKNCVPPSSNLKFGRVSNSIVRGITSLNSKWFHFEVSQCKNFTVTDIHITAPGDSPNTDGIHLSECDLVNVANSNIATGGESVSIDQGCINININNITCGQGHGISVGSRRLQNDDKSVEGVTVTGCTFK